MKKLPFCMVVILIILVSTGFQTLPVNNLHLAVTQNVDASYTFEDARICLYTFDHDFNLVDCLDTQGAYHPQWTPDGNNLLFLGNLQLYQFDKHSGLSIQITDDALYVADYTISPDGTHVLMLRGGTDTHYEIQLLRLTDLQIRTLYSDVIGEGRWILTQFVFSPDGSQIAVSSTQLDSDLNPTATRIALLDIEDGQLNVLPSTQSNSNYMQRPIWSPDGQQIVYATGQYEGIEYRYTLYSIDIDSANVRQLAESSEPISYDWSPDGKRFIYNETTDNVQSLLITNTSTLETTIVSMGSYYRQIHWAQDGIHIAYLRAQGESLWRACVAEITTSIEEIDCLPAQVYVADALAWQPLQQN